MSVITADDADTQRSVDGWYTIGEERFRSVTAALQAWGKGDLKYWSGGLAAKAAFENLPMMVGAMLKRPCERTWNKCPVPHDWRERCDSCPCKECEACVTRWLSERHIAESKRRTDEGSRVHHVIKHWVLTAVWLAPDDDIKIYVDSFKAFVAEYGLVNTDWELAEARVVNRTYRYAGTLDGALRFRRDRSKAAADLLDRFTPDSGVRLAEMLFMIDYKTREKEERALFDDMPLQLAPYRFAEALVLPDGRELPMLPVDATAIIQIRPDKTTVEPVLAEDPEFATFVSLLGADEWAQERGKRAIAARTFSYPESVQKQRAADQRRARAAAKREEAATVATAPEVDNSPAARGARAAAAVKRPDAGQVWADIADQHGGNVGKRLNPTGGPPRSMRDRPQTTLAAAVLGAPARPGQDEEPPF